MTLAGVRRLGPGGPAYLHNPYPGDFSGRNAETEMEEG